MHQEDPMETVVTNGTDPRFHALCRLLDRSLDEAVGGHTQRAELVCPQFLYQNKS